jgi:hypothetical protein
MSASRVTPAMGRVSTVLAVAQHGHAVGHGRQLLEAVRDVHDADAARAQLAHHREQPLDVGLRERGGGLVEHEHARLGAEGARDLDQLLLGRAQPPASASGSTRAPTRASSSAARGGARASRRAATTRPAPRRARGSRRR